MAPHYDVFLNNLWFDSLRETEHYTDKLVFFRHHEKTLWNIYQLLSTGRHQVIITTKARQPVAGFTAAPAFAQWVAGQYPGLEGQLTQPAYTCNFHPHDQLMPPA